MKFGVCGDPAVAESAAAISYDFAEWNVGGFLKPRDDHQAFLEVLDTVNKLPIPVPVVNCFVPGDLKITGPDADLATLKQYVTTTFQRAEEANVEVIVFGSGGARRIPDGFSRDDANEQLLEFSSMLSPIAQDHGVTVVVEPLNMNDCNVLTTVGECATLVRKVDHPNLRLLVDAYHHLKDGDSLDDIASNGDLFAHVHIATVPNRVPPGCEPCDLAPFFAALAKAGYNGRVSIEAKLADRENDLKTALAEMKKLASM